MEEKGVLDKADDIWNTYKHHSGKVSIGLSVLGGIGAILAGKFIVAGSIVVGITNVAIFFSGIAYEKLYNELNNVEKDNDSLKKEKNEIMRRFTTYQFCNEPDKFDIKMTKLINLRSSLDQNSLPDQESDVQTPSNN